MARIITHQLAYTAIRIEGGLIPADELSRLTTLAQPEATEQTDGHYGTPRGLKLRDEIARYFKIAQNLWQEFQTVRQRTDLDSHAATLNNFLLPLLRDSLGYSDLARSPGVTTGDHIYQIGHAALGDRLPVVLASHDQPLDQAAERFGDINPETGRTRRRSPFMLAQEALNGSDKSLWAVLSNGLKLRIMRDNPSLTRPAYVEVDLEALFTEELYADFTAFWLLAHASRFGKVAAEPADCPWERWRNSGQQAGVTVRMNLRYQVANALKALGTGFLSHPANTHLREQLQNQEQASATKQAFFDDLLRLVYRFIFLATVEDRTDPTTGYSLIFTPDATDAARQRYRVGYSLTWLRERAARASSFDTHSDLWQALSITFDGLAVGQPALGLPALGGLFAPDQFTTLAHTHIENRHLLAAVFQLGYFRQPTGLTRVNYRDMGAEELGSVYESLLELVPNLQNLSQPNAAKLAFVGDEDEASNKGNARKLTGSYYTPDSLVQELIRSALEPVIIQTVQANPANPVDALLQLTVCDPACGSGHFLLAAARRLADEVAKLRASQLGGAPSPADYRHALRDVVGHCIYGVDKNPMAIQLAKTALWLEAYTPDRPLTFIDHHLQVGDALLGVLDPKILENGIPDEAYAVLSGDDKAVASALKKQNKADLKSWKAIAANDLFAASTLTAEANAVEHLADDTLDGIAAKRSAWAESSTQARHSTLARLADTYVAAFLAPKVPDAQNSIPLSGYLWALLRGQGVVNADIDSAANNVCRTHSVLHWWLAFPQVAAKGGFDIMLGNPPWEQLQLSEEEFFAPRAPSIASMSGAKRKKAIAQLEQSTPWLWHELNLARRQVEAANQFFRAGGRYPLSSYGKLDTYPLFSETFAQTTKSNGRAGFIVKAGIASDDSNKHFFASTVENQRLVSLYGFDNAEKVFPDVHPDTPFVLMTLGETKESSTLLNYALQVAHMTDERRRFTLSTDEFKQINPNTRTCPLFRSKRDAELTKKLYESVPIFIREAVYEGEGKESKLISPEINPWGISFSQGLFNMTSASDLFRSVAAGPTQPKRLPLFEGKLIHQFDHRWATFMPDPAISNDDWPSRDVTLAEKEGAAFNPTTRYWVEEAEVLARIARVPNRVANAWLAWRNADAQAVEEPSTEATQALSDSREALTLALAGWVAGALFLRAVAEQNSHAASAPQPQANMQVLTASLFGDTTPEPVPAEKLAQPWSDKATVAATQVAERQLSAHHPAFAEELKQTGITGKKALTAFTKWALQDDLAQGLSLSDDELEALRALQAPQLVDKFAISSGSANAHSTDTRAEYGLNFPFMDAWMDRRSPRWLFGFRNVTNATNERTFIGTIFPRMGVGHSMPLIFSRKQPCLLACLSANFSSLTLDYLARQKVGGVNMTYGFVKQFPVLPPDRYYDESVLAYIVPRVLELTHTAHDMQPWADDLAAYDPRPTAERQIPFPWNHDRRAQLRAELDAYYARLYGLTRDELRYILDPADVMGDDYPSETFRVLKKNEMKNYGEYRTQRLVLAAWDALHNPETADKQSTTQSNLTAKS